MWKSRRYMPPGGGTGTTQVFGDESAAAMIDRLVHHAEVIALKSDSGRLQDRDLGRVLAAGGIDE